MWSGPIARITKNSTNWPTANQAWRRLTSSCESGKILTTVCALTKPWDILLPRNSCSSGNANLKRQSVTNLLDEYSGCAGGAICGKLAVYTARFSRCACVARSKAAGPPDESTGERGPLTVEAARRLASLYQSWGKPAEAAPFQAALTQAAPHTP